LKGTLTVNNRKRSGSIRDGGDLGREGKKVLGYVFGGNGWWPAPRWKKKFLMGEK